MKDKPKTYNNSLNPATLARKLKYFRYYKKLTENIIVLYHKKDRKYIKLKQLKTQEKTNLIYEFLDFL